MDTTTLNLTDPLAALTVSRGDLAVALAGVTNEIPDAVSAAVEEVLGGRDFGRAVEAAVEGLTDQVATLTSRLAALTAPTTFRQRLMRLLTGKAGA